MHDPAATVDWEVALPIAVLSMYTSVDHAMVLTPFESLFGRRHLERNSLVPEKNSSHVAFVELRALRVEQLKAKAVATNDGSHRSSQLGYEA